MGVGMLQTADYARHVFSRYVGSCTSPYETSRRLCALACDVRKTCTTRTAGPGGECAVCKQHAGERVLVAAVEVGSGPGALLYGCLPCARTRARSRFAPAWLAEDLAVIDAERGW